jgi:hypothetical protein
MCLIIEQTTQSDPLTFHDVADVYQRNRDGLGVTWRDATGKVQAYTTIPRDAAAAWEVVRQFQGQAATFHFRMRTSGPVDLAHCHPFQVPGGFLYHNGVFSGLGLPKESDTAILVSRVVTPMLRAYTVDDPGVDQFLSAYAGTGNVLVLDLDTEKAPIWYGRKPVSYRGRLYSNTYAWDAPLSVGGSARLGWLKASPKSAPAASAWYDDDPTDRPDAAPEWACGYDEIRECLEAEANEAAVASALAGIGPTTPIDDPTLAKDTLEFAAWACGWEVHCDDPDPARWWGWPSLSDLDDGPQDDGDDRTGPPRR